MQLMEDSQTYPVVVDFTWWDFIWSLPLKHTSDMKLVTVYIVISL